MSKWRTVLTNQPFHLKFFRGSLLKINLKSLKVSFFSLNIAFFALKMSRPRHFSSFFTPFFNYVLNELFGSQKINRLILVSKELLSKNIPNYDIFCQRIFCHQTLDWRKSKPHRFVTLLLSIYNPRCLMHLEYWS